MSEKESRKAWANARNWESVRTRTAAERFNEGLKFPRQIYHGWACSECKEFYISKFEADRCCQSKEQPCT